MQSVVDAFDGGDAVTVRNPNIIIGYNYVSILSCYRTLWEQSRHGRIRRDTFSSFVQCAMCDVASRLRPLPNAYPLGVLVRLSFKLLPVSELEPQAPDIS